MRFRSLGLNIKQLIKTADAGNHGAQAELSIEYLIGEKVERDIPKAIKYMELASKDIYAINMCFKSARETGEPAAYFAIALQWEYGFAVPKSLDENEATLKIIAESLMVAAEKNYPYAQQMLGEKYRFGFGVDEDLKKSEYWHLKALESGVKDAHFDLFLLYSQEEEFVDLKKAWIHLQEAVNSDKPHPNSFLSMAEAYIEEKLTSPNKIEATKWLLIAQCDVAYWKNKLNDLKQTLTKEEWKNAETMAKEWKVKHKT